MTIAVIDKKTHIIENHVVAINDADRDDTKLYIDVPYNGMVRVSEVWDGQPFQPIKLPTKEEFTDRIRKANPNITDELIDLHFKSLMSRV